ADLVFEKSFSLTQSQIDNYNIKIFFFGLNYTADISVNNVIINRHSGGEFPFSFLIPRDILRKDKSNILTVRLSYKLDSENTIPLKQRFLFPQNFGGILRDVYLHLIPNISITDLTLSRNYYPVSKRARLSINAKVENKRLQNRNDSIPSSDNFTLRASATTPDGTTAGSVSVDFSLPRNKEKNISTVIEINQAIP